MQQSKPSLKRARKKEPEDISAEHQLIAKGVDKKPVVYDPAANDLKGTTLLLNSYYHKKLEMVAEAMTEDVGVKINKTPLLAKAARAYIDEQFDNLNLPDLPVVGPAQKTESGSKTLPFRVSSEVYYKFIELAATEKKSPKQFFDMLLTAYEGDF